MSRDLPTKVITPRHQLIPADTRTAADLRGNWCPLDCSQRRAVLGDLGVVGSSAVRRPNRPGDVDVPQQDRGVPGGERAMVASRSCAMTLR